MNPRTNEDEAWEWRERIEAMLRPLAGLASEPPLAVRIDRMERVMKIGAWIATVVMTGVIGLLVERIADKSSGGVRYVEAPPHKEAPK